MTQFSDRIEGEVKTHEAEMLEKAKIKKQKEYLEEANSLIKQFEQTLEMGEVSFHVLGFDLTSAAKYAVILSLNNQIQLLNKMIIRVTDAAADKTLLNEIDEIKLLIETVESITLPGT